MKLIHTKARAIIDRVEELDLEQGRNASGSLDEPGNHRVITIDARLTAELLKQFVRHGKPGVARSRAEAVRELHRMRSIPWSMIQLRDDGQLVFCAEFNRLKIKVLGYAPGAWEEELLVPTVAN